MCGTKTMDVMKRMFMLAMASAMMFAAVCCSAKETGANEKKIERLVAELRRQAKLERTDSSDAGDKVRLPGITVVSEGDLDLVSIRGVGMKLIRWGVAVSGDGDDEEVRRVAGLMSGIHRMIIVDYEDCSQTVRDRFNKSIAEAIGDSPVMMEVKDDGETMRIYGVLVNDGEDVEDVIIFAPESGSMMCFFGTVAVRDVAALIDSDSE